MPVPRFDQPIHTDNAVLQAIDLRNAEDRAALKRRWRAMLTKVMAEELQDDFGAISKLYNETFQNGEESQESIAVDELIATTQWLALFHLTIAQVEQLCEKHFDIAVELTLPWEEMAEDINHVVSQKFDLEDRQAAKDRIREAIKKSGARIGDKQIILGAESTDPTIANWYRDFLDYTKGQEGDALAIVEYLNGSRNAQALTTEDRTKLEGAFKLIKELSIPSTAFGGYEQKRVIGDPVSGHYMYYSQGQLHDTGIEIPEEILTQMRRTAGIDESGKPVALSERVRGAVHEGRYALPPQLEELVQSIEPATDVELPQPAQSDLQEVMDIQSSPEPVESTMSVEELTQELPPLIDTTSLPEPIVSEQQPIPEPVPMPQPEVPQLDERSTEVAPIPAPIPTLVPPLPEAEQIPVPEPVVPLPVQPMPQELLPKAKEDERIDFVDIAQRVLAEYNILFGDYEQEKRFISVVASYLRGVRDRMEAHDALSRSPEEGGVDLRAEQIDEMLDTAEYLLDQEHENPQQKRAQVQFQQNEGPRPTLGEVQEQIIKQRKRDADQWKDIPVLQREAETGGVEDIFSNITLDIDPGPTPVPVQQVQELPSMPTASIADEKLPIMMGPVDELRNMTRTEFRQFNSDPQAASQEILEKIDLLGQESIQKKAEGIEAWKQSPLNKLYVAIGNRSFNDAIPVSQAIGVMESEGKDTLTEEEFHAITDMNRQLRF